MRPRRSPASLLILALLASGPAAPGDVPPYPDEPGYQRRIAGQLEALAERPFDQRARGTATCPDTGLRFRTLAVEGETVQSPYTGRSLVQGPTGYFGPKARGEDGRITAFGGDPLKEDLPPIVARLALGRDDPAALAWLAIPGNVRQHYHFAAVNWARLFGLAGDRLPAALVEDWGRAVANYAENRRPSDGERELQPLPYPYDLVGDPALHLGGGGTENHKTMWRTSTLAYAAFLPPEARISGWPRDEAVARAHAVLERYARGLLTVGSGEYDSGIYYTHSFRGFLNLVDFHPDPGVRDLARATLESLLATAALKSHDGLMAGAQRRGYPRRSPSELDHALALWSPPRRDWPGLREGLASVHQLTSSYRPHGALHALVRKDGVALPFTAWLAHPDYGMQVPARHLETLHVSSSFALGSVQLDSVNNSAQQVTWSLVLSGADGRPAVIAGGQPRWMQRGGHSPYDQWAQHEGLLVHLTGDTVPLPGDPPPPVLETTRQLRGELGYNRHEAFSGPLAALPMPEGPGGPEAFLEAAPRAATSWLWIPREGVRVVERGGRFFLDTGLAHVVIDPVGDGARLVDLPAPPRPRDQQAWARAAEDRLLVVTGSPCGFALEATEASAHGGFEAFVEAVSRRPRATLARGAGQPDVLEATSLAGRRLALAYEGTRLRGHATLDGAQLKQGPAEGLVVESAPLTVGHGAMTIRAGGHVVTLEWTDAGPRWRAE